MIAPVRMAKIATVADVSDELNGRISAEKIVIVLEGQAYGIVGFDDESGLLRLEIAPIEEED